MALSVAAYVAVTQEGRPMSRENVKRTKSAGNGQGSIYRRKDGQWAYARTVHGHRKVIYSRDREVLLSRRHELDDAARLGRPVADRTMTVETLLDIWWEFYVAEGWASNTLDIAEREIRLRLKPELGHIRLSELSTMDVDRLLAKAKQADLAYNTRLKTRGTLSMALKYAATRRLVPENVAQPTRVREERGLGTDEDTWITEGEGKQLLADNFSDSKYALIYTVLLCTGVRVNEALALHWSDVDLDKGRAEVRYSMSRSGNIDPVKTKHSRRQVSLPAVVVTALKPYRGLPKALVFDGQTYKPVADQFHRQVIAKSDIPNCKGYVHSLRHCYATTSLDHGAPLVVVSKQLGHSSIAFTAALYIHHLDHQLGLAADAIDQAFG
jgi:integrase